MESGLYMCGICGYVSKRGIKDKELAVMNNTMVNRGPDDSGLVQLQQSGYSIGMAHRRLAILDLSEQGHQPMFSSSNGRLIVYNGEIYNFAEVRDNLKKLGVEFKSNCDTEVIISAYEMYGVDCVNHFNGMFAFAIFDKKEDKVFVARDRVGKKPLYYYFDRASETFIFASTLQPIMKYPYFTGAINKKALYHYFYYGYICEPESIFENVQKLEPGGMLELKLSNFDLKHESYWNLYDKYLEKSEKQILDYTEAKELLREHIISAVKMRMVSDVPLGTFLSGGIDSSLVTAIAQSVSSTPINTYSIGFYEKKYDESDYAKVISDYLGTKHHCYMVSEEDLIALADNLPFYYDEPFGDSSQLPSMLVSQMAKKDITVALTGDGGDELFCGYGSYDNILKFEKYKKIARLFYPISQLRYVQEKAPTRLLSVMNEAWDDSCQWTSVALKRLIDRLLLTSEDEVRYDEAWLDKKIGVQTRRMLMDIKTYLPGDILHKVDRASMKYSLESRCPLLDHNIVELSFAIPHEFKYKSGEKKYILKDLAYEYVPKKYLDRPKKGFSVPLKKILETKDATELLNSYSTESFLKAQGLFRYEYISTLRDIISDNGTQYSNSYFSNAVNIMWYYYVFQKWYSCYVDH